MVGEQCTLKGRLASNRLVPRNADGGNLTTGSKPTLTATHQEAGALADAYVDARRTTESICAPLEIGDYVVQAMADASPAKWHLGHVSWFFETFLLMPNVTAYQPRNPQYQYLYLYLYLFNSYYNGVGPQFSRPRRGHLSRPTVAEVYRYRRHVDDEMVS